MKGRWIWMPRRRLDDAGAGIEMVERRGQVVLKEQRGNAAMSDLVCLCPVREVIRE